MKSQIPFMLLIDEKFVNYVVDEVIIIISSINPHDKYWKGKSWHQTIKFRENLSLQDLRNEEQVKKVLKWGGIHAFRQYDRVPEATNALERNHIPDYVLNCISSYSKIFSFRKPGTYFIMDSRVIFSINCLLIKFLKTDNLGQKNDCRLIDFKFATTSRNKKIKERSIIFNDYDKLKYIPYLEYNEFILAVYRNHLMQKKIMESNFKDINKPEIIEMILFKCIEDIFNACKLNSNQ